MFPQIIPPLFSSTNQQENKRSHDSSTLLCLFYLTHFDQDPSGRYLILSATFNNQPLIIVNICASNTHQKSFYKSILQKIQHYPKDQSIICRNFNEVIDPQIDSSNTKRRKSTALSSMLCLEDLYDRGGVSMVLRGKTVSIDTPKGHILGSTCS